jgi:hypothetical protein
MTRRKANWIFHISRRKCFLKDVIEGNLEGKGREGGRHKQLLDDLKETRQYWKLKQENLLWERLWTCPKKRPFRLLWCNSPSRT